jgi:hypothetical protein
LDRQQPRDADELTIQERVAASRAAQGLPPVITDPATIERVAALLLAAEVADKQHAATREGA